MRFRNISLILGSLATMLLVFLSDPDLGPGMSLIFGANTLLAVKSVVILSLACLIVHLSRKTLFDYIDMSKFFDEALKTPTGAGLALIGLGLFLVAFSVVFVAISVKI